jgi:hypothetical protein
MPADGRWDLTRRLNGSTLYFVLITHSFPVRIKTMSVDWYKTAGIHKVRASGCNGYYILYNDALHLWVLSAESRHLVAPKSLKRLLHFWKNQYPLHRQQWIMKQKGCGRKLLWRHVRYNPEFGRKKMSEEKVGVLVPIRSGNLPLLTHKRWEIKLCLWARHEGKGEVKVQLHSFLTLIWVGDVSCTLRPLWPSNTAPCKDFGGRLGVPQNWSGRYGKQKKSPILFQHTEHIHTQNTKKLTYIALSIVPLDNDWLQWAVQAHHSLSKHSTDPSYSSVLKSTF